MIFEDLQMLRHRIAFWTNRPPPERINIFESIHSFVSIDTGNILRIEGNDYLVFGHTREGRFGLDEEPKLWVKITIDLTTGQKKIVKMLFNESFHRKIGNISIYQKRNPEKEVRILELMHGHANFMQGRAAFDVSGNMVRVIDFISGPSLYEYLRGLNMPHKEYYMKKLFGIMKSIIKGIEAIDQLHQHGLHHGDIRADHLMLEDGTGTYRWIDFDYDVDFPGYDLLCLGNVLLQVVGKGRHSIHDIRSQPSNYPHFKDRLTGSDMSMMYRHRIANLRELFPYISIDLNNILMRFSAGSKEIYHDVKSLLFDLNNIFR